MRWVKEVNRMAKASLAVLTLLAATSPSEAQNLIPRQEPLAAVRITFDRSEETSVRVAGLADV